MKFVAVVDKNQKPLMPTTNSRAYRWIKSGKATPFFKKGIFCIRLNKEVDNKKQEIAVGVDPGSKREGFTVKSAFILILIYKQLLLIGLKKQLKLEEICVEVEGREKHPVEKTDRIEKEVVCLHQLRLDGNGS